MRGATVRGVARPMTPGQRARLRRVIAARGRAETQTYRAETQLDGVIRQLVDEGASVTSIAEELGITRQGVHKRLRRGIS